MAKRNEKLTVLPLKIYIDENTCVPLDSLTDEQRRQWSAAKTREIEIIVNNYLAAHPENAAAWRRYHQSYLDKRASEEKAEQPEVHNKTQKWTFKHDQLQKALRRDMLFNEFKTSSTIKNRPSFKAVGTRLHIVQRLKFCVSITNVIYCCCNAVRPYVLVIDIFLSNSGAKLLIEYFGVPVIPLFVLWNGTFIGTIFYPLSFSNAMNHLNISVIAAVVDLEAFEILTSDSYFNTYFF